MDFEKFSKQTITRINKQLEKILADWRVEVEAISADLLPLVDKFIDSCKGGKRIRGVLVVLGYEIGKKSSVVSLQLSDKTNLKADSEATPEAGEASLKTESSIIKIAASYEIFHTAILAHDDIIDKSLLRRGQPSLFQALGGNHKGVSLAITLADAGFFLATKVMAESSFADKEKSEALKWFSKTMLDTAMGQVLDIEGGDVITIMKYKTARYTVCGPLILGAILAGGYHLEGEHVRWNKAHLPGELDSLVNFGENLGIAFQIQDDILDSEVDWAGGLDFAKKEAERYKDKAMKIIPQITKDKKMSKLLEQMAGFLVKRRK